MASEMGVISVGTQNSELVGVQAYGAYKQSDDEITDISVHREDEHHCFRLTYVCRTSICNCRVRPFCQRYRSG